MATAQIYKYTKTVVPGPNGYATGATLPEGGNELCTLDGETYVTVPDGSVVLPAQQAEVTLIPVAPDADLRSKIKAASPLVQLLDQQIVDRIRAAYSTEDEMYFARIGVGVALGAYAFQPGEMEALMAFGAYVESCRQWGKSQREALGL